MNLLDERLSKIIMGKATEFTLEVISVLVVIFSHFS